MFLIREIHGRGEGASLRVFVLVNVSCAVRAVMPTGMFIPLL